ncbi:DUF11 domain-containing protein [bacterium]|nr:DUF11 domain-containing protein [bacterium]
MITKRLLIIAAVLFLANPAICTPTVGTVSASTSVGLYNKFEATFSITTVATNPYWPYDASPAANTTDHPNAVPSGVGVTVDGIFLPPGATDWSDAVVQPGFYCLDYSTDSTNPSLAIDTGALWVYPSGSPVWKVRYAPTALGTWYGRIRVTDASGTSYGNVFSFECVSSDNHGFVRVAENDKRYFELTDGKYLPLIGCTSAATDQMSTLKSIGVNLVRSWWQSSSTQFPLFGAGGQGGDPVWKNITYSTDYVRPNHITSCLLPNTGTVWECINTWLPVKKNTTYQFKGTVKTVGLSGSDGCGVYLAELQTGKQSTRLSGNNDWQELTLSLSSGSNYQFRVYVGVLGATSGSAYLSDLSLKEDFGGGQYGPELLQRADFQPQNSYSQKIAWNIDQFVSAAQSNDVYVKAVIEEAGDSFFGCIQSDGTWGTKSAENVYASDTHASRTYQTYFWRYLIARWGYCTAIHSFEFVNEGDPNSSAHQDAVAALGRYMKTYDPNEHLVGSSNWHSVAPVMWSDSDIGIADIHMYMGWDVPSGGNRIWPGWDGSWTLPCTATALSSNYSIDETVKHSGRASLKVNLPANPSSTFLPQDQCPMQFQFAQKNGDQMRLNFWVKTQNYTPYSNSGCFWFDMSAARYGGDWLEKYSGPQYAIPSGDNDWTYISKEWTVSTAEPGATMAWFRPTHVGNHSSEPGTVWVDDIKIENLTTGCVSNYNGGFEYMIPESYDVVADHCAYSRILRAFNFGKPVIRGETGICNTGGSNEQDPILSNDSAGIWWKKLVWSHTDPGGLIDIYWWCDRLYSEKFTYAAAFQSFMAGILLANGHYVDADAASTDPYLRAIGQKDLTNNRAHLWIDNALSTWKNAVDGVSVSPISGTVTLTGLKDSVYDVEWWDTSTGSVSSNDELTCTGGSLVLSVQNLQSDIACKIYLKPAKVDLRIIVPASEVIPGQDVTVTVEYTNNGETDASNVTISARVPADMTYNAGSAELTGGTWDSATKSVSWVVDHIAAHETGTRTFSAKVN